MGSEKSFPRHARQLKIGDEDAPSFREVREQIRDEILAFIDQLIAKYRDYYGRDWRPKLAHLLEQYGAGINRDIEAEIRAEREKLREKRLREERESEGG